VKHTRIRKRAKRLCGGDSGQPAVRRHYARDNEKWLHFAAELNEPAASKVDDMTDQGSAL
jgi:hypothetical protein